MLECGDDWYEKRPYHRNIHKYVSEHVRYMNRQHKR